MNHEQSVKVLRAYVDEISAVLEDLKTLPEDITEHEIDYILDAPYRIRDMRINAWHKITEC